MPEPIDRAELVDILSGHDPIGAGRRAAAPHPAVVTYSRAPAPGEWLVDGEAESPLGSHAAAHAAGRTSEAVVSYGAGHPPESVAERLLGLAELARDSDLLAAVCPVPDEGDSRRPGSWGVEDLSVIAAARICIPSVRWVRPSWRRLGAPACQVAVAFGANDWQIPEDDRTDVEGLAAAVGARAVAR